MLVFTVGGLSSNMLLRNVFLAIFAVAMIASAQVTTDAPFQVRYAANLNLGESYINITNDGANGAPLLGPGFGGAAGNICVNVYAFSPDEQLISCCSCLVTPNGVVNLGVTRDLTSKTLTGVIPTSVVVKLILPPSPAQAARGLHAPTARLRSLPPLSSPACLPGERRSTTARPRWPRITLPRRRSARLL